VTHSPYARAPDLSVTLSPIAVQYLTLIFHQHTEAKDVITSKMFSGYYYYYYYYYYYCGLRRKYVLGLVYFEAVPYVNPRQTVHFLCMPTILQSTLFFLRVAFIGFPAL
jgi:hypothetical protein